MILGREAILAANDLTFEEVDVTEFWGGSVRVRTMTGTERDDFEQSIFSGKGKDVVQNMKNFRAKLCMMCMVDENGVRLFSTQEDVEALGGKNCKALDIVAAVAQKLNGLGTKEVEDLTKN